MEHTYQLGFIIEKPTKKALSNAIIKDLMLLSKQHRDIIITTNRVCIPDYLLGKITNRFPKLANTIQKSEFTYYITK